jgi:PTS system mannitol-specific IIC component
LDAGSPPAFVALDAGLVGPPAPGSIFAYITMLPPDGGAVAGVFAGVAVGAVASFLVATVLLKMFPVKDMADTDTDAQMGDAVAHVPGLV